MKALIIEDEQPAAERLVKLLNEIGPDLIVEGPIDTVTGAINHLRKEMNYDVLFLDVQLADGKCFSIFEHITLQVPVIFITAYDEYAIQAFDLNSIDYLLKPINIEKLKKSLEKLEQIKKTFLFDSNQALKDIYLSLRNFSSYPYKTRFLVNKGDILQSIAIEEIAYFFAQDKYVFLTTHSNERYIINHTLDDLQEKINQQDFFRINRQFLCSFRSIKKINTFFNYKLKIELLPNPGEEQFVSKTRVSDFKQWLDR